MSRRTAVGVVVGAVVLAVSPVMAGAAPLDADDFGTPRAFFRYCAEAQVDTANIDRDALQAGDFSIGGTVYDDLDDFVSSKSAVDVDDREILTRAYYDYAGEGRGMVAQVRCKLRTAESLDEGAWPEGAPNNDGRFAVDPHYGFGAAGVDLVTSEVDAPCSTLNEHVVDEVWSSLVADGLDDDALYDPTDGTVVVEPDETAASGPEWVGLPPTYEAPEPLEVDGDVLRVRTRALNVPTTSPEGQPRFRGANYCTFVGPDYLRAVLLGEVTVG